MASKWNAKNHLFSMKCGLTSEWDKTTMHIVKIWDNNTAIYIWPLSEKKLSQNKWLVQFISVTCLKFFKCKARVFLRRFRDPNRVPRIENWAPRIRENYHQVPRICEIGSLQVHTRYLPFSLKKNLVKHKPNLTWVESYSLILTAEAKQVNVL